jgi:hypothetical protein
MVIFRLLVKDSVSFAATPPPAASFIRVCDQRQREPRFFYINGNQKENPQDKGQAKAGA